MWRGRVFNWGCQAEGRVCWAPRDLLISLHSNSLKNKLCRLQFFFFFALVLVEMWTCRDFCSAPPLRHPFAESYFKAEKWSKTVEKNKIPQRTGTLHTYIQLLPVSTPRSLSLRKQKRATPSDVSLPFSLVSSSSTVLSDIATFQLISLFSPSYVCVLF